MISPPKTAKIKEISILGILAIIFAQHLVLVQVPFNQLLIIITFTIIIIITNHVI